VQWAELAAVADADAVATDVVAPGKLLMSFRSIEDQSSNQCIQIHYSWV
jgi:hypothetical protein